MSMVQAIYWGIAVFISQYSIDVIRNNNYTDSNVLILFIFSMIGMPMFETLRTTFYGFDFQDKRNSGGDGRPDTIVIFNSSLKSDSIL